MSLIRVQLESFNQPNFVGPGMIILGVTIEYQVKPIKLLLEDFLHWLLSYHIVEVFILLINTLCHLSRIHFEYTTPVMPDLIVLFHL